MTDAVWISEAEVVASIDLGATITALEAVFRLEASGGAKTMDKTSIVFGEGDTLHAVGGAIGSETKAAVGTKTWAHTAGGATPLLILWDSATGRLQAVIEAFALGQLRTAGVSAVATSVLAAPGARVAAIIGSGKQALPQAAALAAARPLDELRIHSPNPSHRAAMAARAQGAAAHVSEVPSVEEAVDGADIVTTVTRAASPFLRAALLGPRTHVNAVGAISPERRELADDVAGGAALVVSDSVSAARTFSRELDGAEIVRSLSEVVAAPPAVDGRTVFKAMGLGLADVAVGALVLERVLVAGAGRPLSQPDNAVPGWFR